MTSRERVVTALRHGKTDRAPFDFALGFSPYQIEQFRNRTGLSDPQEYFEADTRGVHCGPTKLTTDFRSFHTDLSERVYIDEWGIGHLPTESDSPMHAHLSGFLYPTRGFTTARQFRDYPLPDIEAEYRYAHLPEQVRALHDRGLAVHAGMHCTLFEMAWYMRSMEQFFADCIDNPEFAEIVLDRMLEKRIVQARYFAEAGVDMIQLGDDVASQRGMMMSLPMWRRWFKQRMQRLIAEIRAVRPDMLIFYHTDGNVSALIPDLIEVGIDILNPVQPECMDPVELKRLYGDRLSFHGCLGTQSVFPFGTADEVRDTVRHLIETVGVGGGLLLSPTHMVEPEVPWENIVAFVETVKERGKY